MPDWASHILFALLICEVINIKRKKSLVVLGALLPDILSKIHYLGFFFNFNWEYLFIFFHPASHSFIGALLLSLIASGFFKYDQKESFILLVIGSLSHVFLDLLNRLYFYGPMFLFLPFTFQSGYFRGVWEQNMYPILMFVLLMGYLTIVFSKLMIKNKPKQMR